jgi:hypothetical protein
MRMKTTVKVDNRFPQLRYKISEGAIPRALTQTAKEGARAAAAVARTRSATGTMSNIKVTPPKKDARGWNIVFFSSPFYAWFHEHGTRGSRRRKLKQPGSAQLSREPGTGIKPLRFLAAGRRVARGGLLDNLRRELSKIP